ncbi:MAG: DUF11 domain-containing protein [Chloroflexi bacterium]|nr:DUF11 domain-containing protein [Chloroflexota bacterium]
MLDVDGNPAYGPINLTNNTAWGTSNDVNRPSFSDPRIAATGDNRFMLAWWASHRAAPTGGCSYCSVDDIYYAVRDSRGSEVKPASRLTSDTPGTDDGYYGAALTRLSGNRALLTTRRGGNYGDVYSVVLDSAGSVVRGMTNLSGDGPSQTDWMPAAVQIPGGNTVVAWSSGWAETSVIRFAVLDASYGRVSGPTLLTNPAARGGNYYISVAADGAGNVVLTWMDFEYPQLNLYYALVDGAGSILTPPQIFQTSRAASPSILTSFEGYGSASYNWTPVSGVDAAVAFDRSVFGASPGQRASVTVRYANHGATKASGIVLTAIMDSGLSYSSDTSGITPTVSGNSVVWRLPELSLLESRGLAFAVEVPSGAAYGTRYPVTVRLSTDSPDTDLSDNTSTAQVIVTHRLFLPFLRRGVP